MSVSKFYDDLAQKHGRSYKATDTSSQEAIEKRWKVLVEVPEPGETLLDVGCAYAEFADYLEARDVNVVYTGVDVSQGLIDHAAEKWRPSLSCADVRELDGEWDVVMAQGILYKHKDHDVAYDIVAAMWERARRVLAFTTILNAEPGELTSVTIRLLRE